MIQQKEPPLTVEQRELFAHAEELVRPMIQKLARRYARPLGVTVDDAIQEGRCALIHGMRSYDYTRARGGLRAYANTCIRNAYNGMLYRAATQRRMPHTVYRDDDGQIKAMRHPLASLDELLGLGNGYDQPDPDMPDPEACLVARRQHAQIATLRMRLLNSLGPEERRVFECVCTPSEDFLVFMRNEGAEEPTNPLIGRYLGRTKNAVDWSLYKIRKKFTHLVESTDFSELMGERLKTRGWPMIHVSNKSDDATFVRNVMRLKKLDHMPLPRQREVLVTSHAGRTVEYYAWGIVMFLRYREEQATLVIEGRVNLLLGDVFGDDGTLKNIGDTLPWYLRLVRELRKP